MALRVETKRAVDYRQRDDFQALACSSGMELEQRKCFTDWAVELGGDDPRRAWSRNS